MLCVSCVGVCRLVLVFLPLLVLRMGCEIRLYEFIIIAFDSTKHKVATVYYQIVHVFLLNYNFEPYFNLLQYS